MDARSTAIWTTTALLLYAGAAEAQEVPAVPPGPDTIIPMHKGDVAPVDGQLFDNATALRWGNWLMSYKALVANNKELDQTICKAQVDLQQAKLNALQVQYDTVTKDLQTKLEKAQADAASPPWYKTPTVGFVAGVAVTLVIGGVVAYAVHH